MKPLLVFLSVLTLGAPALWGEHFRFSRFYGPGSFFSYRSPAAYRHHRLIPYGSRLYGTRSYYGSGFYRGHPYGAKARPYGYTRGYAYGGRHYGGYGYKYSGPAYPRRYYTNYETRGTYAVYLGPSNPASVVRANYSDLIFSVSPKTALVYIDGNLIGSARSFADHRNRFPLVEGTHQLRIEYPGYRPFESTLQVVPDRNLHIDVQLEPEP